MTSLALLPTDEPILSPEEQTPFNEALLALSAKFPSNPFDQPLADVMADDMTVADRLYLAYSQAERLTDGMIHCMSSSDPCGITNTLEYTDFETQENHSVAELPITPIHETLLAMIAKFHISPFDEPLADVVARGLSGGGDLQLAYRQAELLADGMIHCMPSSDPCGVINALEYTDFETQGKNSIAALPITPINEATSAAGATELFQNAVGATLVAGSDSKNTFDVGGEDTLDFLDVDQIDGTCLCQSGIDLLTGFRAPTAHVIAGDFFNTNGGVNTDAGAGCFRSSDAIRIATVMLAGSIVPTETGMHPTASPPFGSTG